jgi:peptidoglycan/LPS O-acetylase OafA/YrhL
MKRLDALTGIRAFAALSVVVFHYQAWYLSSAVFPYGYLGVDLFFILSGFVISYAHQRDFASLSIRAAAAFYGLRLARIYPVHIAVLIAMIAMVSLGGLLGLRPRYPEQFRLDPLIANVLLVHAWGPWAEAWNGPSWSISCEWFAYLLFPPLLYLCSRVRFLGALMAVLFALFLVSYQLVFDGDLNQHQGLPALLRVFLEFAMGMVLFQLYARGRLRGFQQDAAIIAALVVWLLSRWTNYEEPVTVAIFCLFISAATGENILVRLLRLKPFVYLGEISYSIYMIHLPLVMSVGKAGVYLMARGWNPWLVMGSMILLTVGLASLMHHFIEVPCRTALREMVLHPSWSRRVA